MAVFDAQRNPFYKKQAGPSSLLKMYPGSSSVLLAPDQLIQITKPP
jgi:hypothetical protein